MRSVKRYYSRTVQAEWDRLQGDPYHRLELDTTLAFLKRYLPKRGVVLDAGGGPGRYAIELARMRHEVVLLDLVRKNLAFARKRFAREGVASRVREVVEGSVVDLSRFRSGTFDGVVCLGGPLSHVMKERERRIAIAELFRVAKKGSPVFISVLGRLAMLATELVEFPEEVRLSLFRRIRDRGDYLGERGFTAAHFFYPEELKAAVTGSARAEVVEMVGLEGVGSAHKKEVNALARDPLRWKVWLETHRRTCTHPSVVGMSEHIMIVARKKG